MSTYSTRRRPPIPKLRWLLLWPALGLLTACSTSPLLKDDQNQPAKMSPALRQDYRQALADLADGRLAAAEERLDHIIAERPDLAGPHVNRGLLYARSQRPDEALAEQRRALAIRDDLAVAYNQIGILQRQAGRFEAARQAYRQALAIDDGYANAELNLGILLDLYLQQPHEALEHYQRYQTLLDEPDATVHQWITDLGQRLKSDAATQEESR